MTPLLVPVVACHRIPNDPQCDLARCLTPHQVGTPRTHRRYLGRDAGTYGPIPSRRPLGMVGMPFNRCVLRPVSLTLRGATGREG